MSISQSRANSRGPLIAVIKIEIEDDQVDRIFLHQNDDDYRLAEQFQQKHRLNHALVNHIYHKIRASRQSLQKDQNKPQQAPTSSQIAKPTPSASISQNQNKYIGTPNPREVQISNTYRNYEDTASPFDHIPHFTPAKEEIQQSANDAYSSFRNQRERSYSGLVQYHHGSHDDDRDRERESERDRERESERERERERESERESERERDRDRDREMFMQRDGQSSTFDTFVQGNQKNSGHDLLFQRYLKERSNGAARLIIKDPKQTNDDWKEKNDDWKQRKVVNDGKDVKYGDSVYFESKQSKSTVYAKRNQSIQKDHGSNSKSNIWSKKDQTDSHYSFNEDKPERVKILKRQQIQSIQSLQSSKKSLNKKQRQKIAKQVTTRLYNECDIKKNYLNKIKQRAKIEKQQKQDKELTHRPQINKVSQLIAADRYKNVPVQDYLIDRAKKAEVKKEAERAIKAQKEMEDCSFKPKVNVISQKLARNHSRSGLKDNHNNTLDECSRKHSHSQRVFRPSLNKMSQLIMRQKNQGNFQERLKTFLQKKNNKLNQLTKQKTRIQQQIDQKGQQLFHPRIYSKPQNRSPKGSQIHDYLYQLSKLDKSHAVEQQKPTINQNSQYIIQQMYAKRIAWLFSELDSDQDGFISPKRICIDTVGEDVLEVMIPVLFEMEEMDIQLNLLDFRNAIRNLHPSLNAHQKSILYNYNNKPPAKS